jgi:chromosome segregation ATPase
MKLPFGYTIIVFRGGPVPPNAIMHTLARLEKRMSNIEEKLAQVSGVLDSVASGVSNLAGDVGVMRDEIQSLKDQLSGLTPEQEAAFDSVIAKASSLKDAVDALDALTPAPEPKPEPTTPVA